MTRSSVRLSALFALTLAAWGLFGSTAEASLCLIPHEQGDWSNIDRDTQSVTRLEFDVECTPRSERRCSGGVCSIRGWFEHAYKIHPFGACSPQDCDWGVQTGEKRDDWYVFRFDQGFGVKTVWVRFYPEHNALRMWTHRTYRDARADGTSDDWFRK